MFFPPYIPKNRIPLWVLLGLLMLFLVGCSGSKTTDGKDGPTQESAQEKGGASKGKKGSEKKVAEAEKKQLEEERKVEEEQIAEKERLAKEKRLAEERKLKEAEERRLAEEKYRAEQVRKALGDVQPPPPSVSPPEPVVDQSGNTRIFVQSADLEAAGPLDQSVTQLRRERGTQSGRMGRMGTVNISDKISDSSVQRGEQPAADAHRQDSMPGTGNMPAGEKPMAKAQRAQRATANTMITLVPFESAVPPLPKEPVLRVAVLSDIEQPEKADQVALIIGNYTKEALENRLGMMVKIAYVAQIKRNITRQSVIRYRPKFFRAAVTIAKVLPRDQALSPMTASELSQQDVDLVVYIGRDYR